jgi:molybdopterin-guanine dinucleotide biosynthesis protein A
VPNGSRSAVPPGLRPLGAILAGGRSRRYGTPKAFAEVGGVSLVERARRALEPSTRAVILVGDDPRLGAFGLPLHPDVHPDIGPLAGLHTALRAAAEAGTPGAFVLACDLPLVPSDLVRALVLRFAEAGGRRAVLPESPGPLGVEPLCGCYPVAWLPEVTRRVEAAARAGEADAPGVEHPDAPSAAHVDTPSAALDTPSADPPRSPASMIALIREIESILVPLEEVSQIMKVEVAFLNVNRPEDRERAEAWSGGE